jgi:hypothetical protein
MQISTSQLLFARWYPGLGMSVAEARAELRRRGWSRARQWLALALVLPCILPDRIARRLDPARDELEETGTSKEVLFRALFSAFMVSLFGVLSAAYGIFSAHDSGRPFSWCGLLAWLGVAIASGWASRVVSRREA